jgi:hypothetical protein
LDPARFTIRTIPERFASMADPVIEVFGPGVDVASAIARVERRMSQPAEPKESPEKGSTRKGSGRKESARKGTARKGSRR